MSKQNHVHGVLYKHNPINFQNYLLFLCEGDGLKLYGVVRKEPSTFLIDDHGFLTESCSVAQRDTVSTN